MNKCVIPSVIDKELWEIFDSFGVKTAPGLDGISKRNLKLTVKTCLELLVNIFEAWLKDGIFSAQRKNQKLVLLPKTNKSPRDSTSYRSMCLLDTMRKIMERIIYNRLLRIVGSNNGLLGRQYG